MTAVVELDGLAYAVGRRRLVDGVSLAAAAGELIALVGPNGAGKSTLLRLATGEIAAGAGAIRYDGRPLAGWPGWRLAAKRAVMTQAATLAFPFAVFEVVRIGIARIGRALAETERDRVVERCLEAAGVAGLAARSYPTLSGGEQQRVRFARALAQLDVGRSVEARQVLFLDEPVASLDLKHQLALMRAVRGLADAGTAVVIVLHDLDLAAAFADRVVVMQEGRAVAAGRPAEALTDDVIRAVFEVEPRFALRGPLA
jgi:iron complex transport system ATP-binding protein